MTDEEYLLDSGWIYDDYNGMWFDVENDDNMKPPYGNYYLDDALRIQRNRDETDD